MRRETRRNITFVFIVLGFFMALLDSTIVNIALPAMAKYYKESVGDISWVVNGYNLAFAVFILTASRLADQFGRKRLFLVGLFVFTLASLLACFAPSVRVLIALRVLQGLAGAVVVPVTIPLAAGIFPKEMHGLVIGAWGAISGLAAASGPTLGGILTSHFAWQSVFSVNVPIGVITMAAASLLLKESVDPTAGRQIDYLGVASISVAMFALTYGLIRANDLGWGSAATTLLFATSLVSFGVFAAAEAKGTSPMLPMWLLRIREFDFATLTLLVVGAGIMNATFLMSFFLTQIRGLTVLQAGVTISVMPLASIVLSVVAGPLSSRLGSRWFAFGGLALMMFAVHLFAGLTADSTRLDAVWRLAIMGFGLGMNMAPVMASSVRNVPDDKVGVASGVTNMARSLGAVLGVALIVTVLNTHMGAETARAKKQAIALIGQSQVLDSRVREPLVREIRAMDLSGGGQALTQKQVLAKVEKEGRALAAAMPPLQRMVTLGMLAGQEKEIARIFPQVEGALRAGAARAFSSTFRFFSLVLGVGLVFALLSDRAPARALTATDSAAQALDSGE